MSQSEQKQTGYYHLGGNLNADHPTYVERRADKILLDSLKDGRFCYVFNARQMGKSSLKLKTIKTLQSQKITCISIDLTKIGATGVTLEQWYFGLISILFNEVTLDLKSKVEPLFNLENWWTKKGLLPPIQRFRDFIEEILLKLTKQNIVIFLDEIDTVLSLEFSADDFFATIRDCYQSRSTHEDYERLTFCLVGVANPSDLIRDERRTPFNIGEGIQLDGFTVDEAEPLIEGIRPKTDNPTAVLREILYWTGGQPFLTQKLCNFVSLSESRVLQGQEKEHTAAMVRANVIADWEIKDDPKHLQTIRKRILESRQSPSRLLSLYQKIYDHKQISADNTPEQAELRLSGLVVKRDGKLEVFNPIYKAIFNESWIRAELIKLRPYDEAIKAWLASGRTEASRLLQGKALRDALAWAKDNELHPDDKQFLEKSQKAVQVSIDQTLELLSRATPEVAAVLREFAPKLKKIADRPVVVIQEIGNWAGSDPFLTQQFCQLIASEPPGDNGICVPEGEEAKRIETLAQEHLIYDWENQAAGAHLSHIYSAVFRHVRCVELLELYQRILQEDGVQIGHTELEGMLNGLVKNQDGKLVVSNQIYNAVFTQEWVEKELEIARSRRVIDGRYEVIEILKNDTFTHTYRVKDRYEESKEYIVEQLTPTSTDPETLRETKRLFESAARELRRISGSSCVPKFDKSFEEDQDYYLVREPVDGTDLDKELKSSSNWSELKVVRLLIETLSGLKFIHERDVAHRNIRPSSIILRSPDQSIVFDNFGFLPAIVASTIRPEQRALFQQEDISEYIPPEDTGEWSDTALDVYALGLIGIQFITGKHPGQLNRDKNNGEFLWHVYPTQVKLEFAKILSKMVCHNSAERYQNVSEILQDLHRLKTVYFPQGGGVRDRINQLFAGAKHENPWTTDSFRDSSKIESSSPWFKSKGAIVAGVSSLVLAGTFGIGWIQTQQRFEAEQQRQATQTAEQSKQASTQQKQKWKQCHTLLGPSFGAHPDVNMITIAGTGSEACSQVLAQPNLSRENKVMALKARGKAYLLLWKSALLSQNKQQQQDYLKKARASFEDAIKLTNTDPQLHFYLGFIRQKQYESKEKVMASFSKAIDGYLNPSQPKSDGDVYVMARLASLLAQEPTMLQRAIALYQEAITKKKNTPGLYYNLAILQINANNTGDAANSFAKANEIARDGSMRPYLNSIRACIENNISGSACLRRLPNNYPTVSAVYSCSRFPALALTEEANPKRSFCK